MDIKELRQIINRGKTPFVDFGKCTTELIDSVFQSICSFLNKEGGRVIVGVGDYGEITGLAEVCIDNMLERFANVMAREFSPAFSITPEIVEINGRKLFCIEAPESTEVHRYKNKVYDRVGSEVFDVTYSYNLVENLYLRKLGLSSENIVCPFLRMPELNEATFRLMRERIAAVNPGHPWLELGNEEFLRMNGFWRKVPTGDKEGFVLAAVMLFGKEETIQNYNPVTYRTDAVYRNITHEEFAKVNSGYPESRYDDRDIIFSNLIETYGRLTTFAHRHLPERELYENAQPVDIREILSREIITNLLVHREYVHKDPGRLLIFADKVITENGTRSPKDEKKTFDTLDVRPGNPLIAKVFQAMGCIEKPGSGQENIPRYAPFYDRSYEVGMEISPKEKFIFSITYGRQPGMDDLSLLYAPSLRKPSHVPVRETPPQQRYASRLWDACPGIDISYVEKAEIILEACVKPLPIQDMMRIARQSNRTRFRQNIIRPMVEEGLLAMRIPTKPSSPLQKYFTTEKGKALL